MEFDSERPPELMIDAKYIRHLAENDLRWIRGWCDVKGGEFGPFGGWLEQIAIDEFRRRQGEPVELAMVQLPRLEVDELGEFLLASYHLSQMIVSEQLHQLFNQIHKAIIVDVFTAIHQHQIRSVADA